VVTIVDQEKLKQKVGFDSVKKNPIL